MSADLEAVNDMQRQSIKGVVCHVDLNQMLHHHVFETKNTRFSSCVLIYKCPLARQSLPRIKCKGRCLIMRYYLTRYVMHMAVKQMV